MSENKPAVGSISWFDLTVENADQVRDFYREVVGWDHAPVDMGDYSDYCMNRPDDGQTVAGICHARGANADIPPTWMMYITVADLDASLEKCLALGGQQLSEIRSGGGRFVVIRDPAGAVAALFEQE